MDFARGLAELGVEIVSTGGTAKELRDEGIAIRPVEDYTGFPEILDGRVKTLHPRIHAGLLAVRSDDDHVSTLNEHEIEPIDLVCVNLYPFERVSSRRGVEDHEGDREHRRGRPHADPRGGQELRLRGRGGHARELRRGARRAARKRGHALGRTRESLALEAFAYTARYDTAIARWFAEREDDFPSQYTMSLEKVLDLPYGENPHQRAALYAEVGARTHLLSMVSKLHGKELSFNNLLDLDSGRRLVDEFELPAVAIIKHNNPCGVAIGAHQDDAFELALATDRQSAYGGIVCLNRPVERALAQRLNSMFLEAVLAPGFSDEALEILQAKPDVRLLENQERRRSPITEHDMKRVRGGLLVQDRDTGLESREEMRAVTKRTPSEEEWGELIFAMRVCKHVRSNAIVMSKGLATAGIGAGQMSRVDSVRIAIDKAGQADIDLNGAVMASDAFFPFSDGPQTAIDAGVRAIIQPGGSRRDDEVVEACDQAGVAMVFTARRHFRH